MDNDYARLRPSSVYGPERPLESERPGGDTRIINVPDLQARLTDPNASDEDYVDPFRTLSWWWNFHIPDMVALSAPFRYMGDYGNFEWLDWNNDGKGDASSGNELRFSLAGGYTRGRIE